MLFPEMDATARRAGDHHRLLGHPAQVAGRRDVRLRAHGGEAQGRARRPPVLACTLLPYDPQFELGRTLARRRGLCR